jgi:putative endonuclease
MDYVVYILYSTTYQKTYVGFTSDLIMRMKSHNIFGKDSTRHYRPWIVIHVEFFEDKVSAMKREKYYKSGRGLYAKKEIVAQWLNTLP